MTNADDGVAVVVVVVVVVVTMTMRKMITLHSLASDLLHFNRRCSVCLVADLHQTRKTATSFCQDVQTRNDRKWRSFEIERRQRNIIQDSSNTSVLFSFFLSFCFCKKRREGKKAI